MLTVLLPSGWQVWRATGLAKLAAARQYLTDVLAGSAGGKVLVFGHHRPVCST